MPMQHNTTMISSYSVAMVTQEIVENLKSLTKEYAKFLQSYEKELLKSATAQEKFVEFLPRLLHRKLGPVHSFKAYFATLINEDVSLFNITYLKEICSILPDDVR